MLDYIKKGKNDEILLQSRIMFYKKIELLEFLDRHFYCNRKERKQEILVFIYLFIDIFTVYRVCV